MATARAGDPGRGWDRIRSELGRSVVTETRTTRRGITRTMYRVDETIAKRLANQCIYVEQGKSGSGRQEAPAFRSHAPRRRAPEVRSRSSLESDAPRPRHAAT